MGILSRLVIATTGALPAESNNIKKWVEANGGKWAPKVVENVTHLIASKEAWTRVTDPVMKAAELNIHIVSYDWLEDSLQGKRKLAEKKYTWEVIKKDKKRKRQLKKLGKLADGTSVKLPRERKPKKSKSFFFAEQINTPFVSAKDDLLRRRAEREAKEAADKAAKAEKAAKKSSGSADVPIEIEDDTPDPNSSALLPTPPSSVSPARLASKTASPAPSESASNTPTPAEPQAKTISLKDRYHYYLDSTGFEYKVTLARANPALNNITRYQLSILENHTTPHTYCTLVQYAPPGGVPESTTSTPKSGNTYASMRNPLLNFLKQPDPTPATQPSTSTPNQEATRLRTLITPAPVANGKPYKTLICPLDSPFAPAWRAFRHAFRDLTLLSWEERFDTAKTLQKVRAKALGVEPYTYSRPMEGMPVGLRVQEAGLYQAGVGSGEGLELVVPGDAETGYTRNEFSLPGVDEVLGTGLVGAAIKRDEDKIRAKEREEERKVQRVMDEEKKRVKEEKKRARRGFNKPLFNFQTGRAEPGAWERNMRGGMGVGTVKKAGKPHWGWERD
ncbi:hypothetical protein FB567DRAFT_576561 [Paraphoma chrysanthemicola]|uniref:BRCT domain-containing protein n=1 Tax=Paraphoma chrysanthemicola TaxID=798071 RepID=A0A8K0RCZ6_9PLEO|nr:hypothetical protein FB567DRAFT_576561 [Paraphoma chrysanthemicola]